MGFDKSLGGHSNIQMFFAVFSLVVGRTRLIFTELPYRVNSGVSMFAQPNKLFEIGYVEWFFFLVKLSGVDG